MKRSNPGAMSENPKQKEENESRHDAGEPETKRRGQILVQCLRTETKEGIKFGCDAGD